MAAVRSLPKVDISPAISIQSKFQSLKFHGINIPRRANHAYNLYETGNSCMRVIFRAIRAH